MNYQVNTTITNCNCYWDKEWHPEENVYMPDFMQCEECKCLEIDFNYLVVVAFLTILNQHLYNVQCAEIFRMTHSITNCSTKYLMNNLLGLETTIPSMECLQTTDGINKHSRNLIGTNSI